MLSNIFLAMFTTVMVTFMILNLIVGCEDWRDPVCITPSDMIGWVIK